MREEFETQTRENFLEYISISVHIEQKLVQYIGIITCNTLGKYHGYLTLMLDYLD